MTDYEKLKGIIDEIDTLIGRNIRSSEPEFQAWRTKAERFLIKKFGKDSLEHRKFANTYFSPLVWYGSDMEQENRDAIKWCCDGLKSCKAIFETYLEDISEENLTSSQGSNKPTTKNMGRVFIVHGHDGELKQSVARIIEKQGIEAIILSEQANKGRTIIEKFEDYSDVGGAICLFTADDFGRAKKDENDSPRARQNVVFEAGYFMGKLGRCHVVIIAEHGVELPSDMQGIVYTGKSTWEIDALKELKAMGYTIDFNKLL